MSSPRGAVHAGDASLAFQTTGAFDTSVRYVLPPEWNLSRFDHLHLAFYAENTNDSGFQNGSPWGRLLDAAGNYFQYQYYQGGNPTDILDTAIGMWQSQDIPLNASGTVTDGWRRTTSGTPDLSRITALEIHADTWGYNGFSLWLDDVGFRYSANQQYVDAAYVDVLGRHAEPTGLQSWGNALDQGKLSRPQVASALTHSVEYYSNIVTNAYQTYLGRLPDQAGLNAWVQGMQNGLSDERLEAGFIGSQEYIASHGGQGAGWVIGMYHDLLGRTPAQSEIDSWVHALNQGVSPQQVAYGFAASPEREGIRVRGNYSTYLGRSANPQEVNSWVNAFLNGYSNEDLVAGFVGSDEYFRRHTQT